MAQLSPKPDIKVEFRTLARTTIQRSQRGIMYMITSDTTMPDKYKTLASISDLVEAEWDASNYKYLQLAFQTGPQSPYKIVVRNINSDTIGAALKEFETRKMNYLACPITNQQDDATVVAWVKNRWEAQGIIYFSSFVDDADSVTVCHINNSSFKHKSLGDFNGQEYGVAYAALFAGMPLNRSGDNLVLNGLVSVTDSTPKLGSLTAYNDDDKVRIVYAINSKVTYDSTWKPDTRKIKVVEGMNIVRFDIKNTFKDYWLGLYINDYDNKKAFCNIVNQIYFKNLEPNVLSADYDNEIDVDTEKQRQAVIADGKDPNEMTELEIRRFPTSDNVYLAGDARFSDTMANLALMITM